MHWPLIRSALTKVFYVLTLPYNHLLGSCSFDSGWISWLSMAVCVQRRFCTHTEIRMDSVLVLEFNGPTHCCRGQGSHKMGRFRWNKCGKASEMHLYTCVRQRPSRTWWWAEPKRCCDFNGHIPFYCGWSGAKSTDTHLHRSTRACARLEEQKRWAWLIHNWQVGNPVGTRDIQTKVRRRPTCSQWKD